MITQLVPLLSRGSLSILVTELKPGTLRVVVAMRPKGTDHKPAPSLSVEGSAADLDAGLPDALATYSSRTVSLTDSIASLDAEIADIETQKKAELATKRKGAAKPAEPTAAKPAKTPAVTSVPAPAPEPDLFSASTPAGDSSAQPGKH